MNNADRRRIAKLISSAYQARRAEIQVAPSHAEQTQTMQAILTRHKPLRDRVAKVRKAREALKVLEKELSMGLAALRKDPPAPRWRHGCECHDDWESLLRELASTEIRELKEAFDKSVQDLLDEERKMLARVEVARTTEDLEAIMKEAKLLT